MRAKVISRMTVHTLCYQITIYYYSFQILICEACNDILDMPIAYVIEVNDYKRTTITINIKLTPNCQ